MGSGNTFEDFKRGDIVFYVPRHLQPKDGSSPLISDTEKGIVSSKNTRYIGVKYYRYQGKTRSGKKRWSLSVTAQSTSPEDLWKID